MSAPAGLPQPTVEILASIGEHRVLTTAQVRAIHLADRSVRRAEQVMASLGSAGLVSYVQSPGGLPRRLWFLTEAGSRTAKGSGALSVAPRVLEPEQAAGQLRAHTMAVNDAAISFLKAARSRGDEFGSLSWQHEVVHSLNRGRGRRRRVLRADAVFTYLRSAGDEVFVEQRFLEADRATLSVDRLASELSAYAELFRATDERDEPIWRHRYPVFPLVLCVLSGGTRAALERRRNTAIALLRSDPDVTRTPEVTFLICLAEDLRDHGPFAPIFRDPHQRNGFSDWLGLSAKTDDGEGR